MGYPGHDGAKDNRCDQHTEIVALHRIEPGEEITYDYGREYLNYFLDNGGCRCAACRKAARRRKSKTGRGRHAHITVRWAAGIAGSQPFNNA
jgi:hypothetical protein